MLRAVRKVPIVVSESAIEDGPAYDEHTFIPSSEPEGWLIDHARPVWHYDENGELVRGGVVPIALLRTVRRYFESQGYTTFWAKPKKQASLVVCDAIHPTVRQWRDDLIAHNTADGVTKWDKVVGRLTPGGQHSMSVGFGREIVERSFVPEIRYVDETKGMIWVSERVARNIVVWENRKRNRQWTDDTELHLRTGHKLVNGPYVKGVIRVVPNEALAALGGGDIVIGRDNIKVPIDHSLDTLFRRVSEHPDLYCRTKKGRFPLIWKITLGIVGGNENLANFYRTIAEAKQADAIDRDAWIDRTRFGPEDGDVPAWAAAAWAGVPPTDEIIAEDVQRFAGLGLQKAINTLDDFRVGWSTAVYAYPGELSPNEVKVPDTIMRELGMRPADEIILMRSPVNGVHSPLRVRTFPTHERCTVVHPSTWDITLGDVDGDRAMVTNDPRVYDHCLPFRDSITIHVAAAQVPKGEKSFQPTEEEAVALIQRCASIVGLAVNTFTAGIDRMRAMGRSLTHEDILAAAREWNAIIQPAIDGLKHGGQDIELPRRDRFIGKVKRAIMPRDLATLARKAPLTIAGENIMSFQTLAVPATTSVDWRAVVSEWAATNLSEDDIHRVYEARRRIIDAYHALRRERGDDAIVPIIDAFAPARIDSDLTDAELAIGAALAFNRGAKWIGKIDRALLRRIIETTRLVSATNYAAFAEYADGEYDSTDEVYGESAGFVTDFAL